MVAEGSAEQIIKSRKRVRDHGEVFTPSWLVKDMCDLVAQECDRAESRFFEPACGDGNFLAEILTRKLDRIKTKYRRDIASYEKESFIAVTSIYGVDLLPDNVAKCRERLLDIWIKKYPKLKSSLYPKHLSALRVVLSKNILCGDALTLCQADGSPLVFTEWSLEEFGTALSMRSYRLAELLNAESHRNETKAKAPQAEFAFEEECSAGPRSTELDHRSREHGIAIPFNMHTLKKYWELTDEC